MRTEPRQRPYLATLWMVGALISISGMAIAGRELSSELNAFQISFTRSFLCLFSLLILLTVVGFKKVKTHKLKLHIFRNTIHFGGQTGWLYGVALLPLAEVFAIEFTAPIWTAILATILLKERLTLSGRQYLDRFHRDLNYLKTGIADNSTRCIGSIICNSMFCFDICIHAVYVVYREPVDNHFLYESSTTPNRFSNLHT